jgi:hypothetical protein
MHLVYKYILLLCFLSLILPYGCIPKKISSNKTKHQTQQKTSPSPTKEQAKKMKSIKQIYYVHVVRWGGESLSLISRWYIGNFKDWKLLAKHNPELDPYNIHVGDRVWIPKERMKTLQPMPETLLNNKQEGKKSLELYGPKDHKERIEQYSNDQ